MDAPIKHKDPLNGITLEDIVKHLVEKYGWPELALRIRINCFAREPSVKSTLVFLRKTPWARKKVEDLYIYSLKEFPKTSGETNSRVKG